MKKLLCLILTVSLLAAFLTPLTLLPVSAIGEAALPSSAHPYENKSFESHTISREGAYRLGLLFSDETHTEAGFDYVRLCRSDETTLGSYTADELSGAFVVVPNDTVVVKLLSDELGTSYGFDIIEVVPFYTQENACTHSNMRTENVRAASCYTEGNSGDVFCADCGKLLEEGTKSETVSHAYKSGFCTVCGADKELEELCVPEDYETYQTCTYTISRPGAAIIFLTFSEKTRFPGAVTFTLSAGGESYQLTSDEISGETFYIFAEKVTLTYRNISDSVTNNKSYGFWVDSIETWYEKGGLCYSASSGYAQVIGFTEELKGSVVIPDTVEKCAVEVIDAEAFAENNAITQVILPPSIAVIGDLAFYGCTALEKVVIPSSVKTISGNPFQKTSKNLTLYVESGSVAEAFAKEHGYRTAPISDTLKIKTQPKIAVAQAGVQAKVSVKAEGYGLTYQWYYRDVSSDEFVLTNSFKGNTYSVAMNEARDGRELYCVITDQYGNTVTTKTVSIHMGTPLKVLTQPKSVTVAYGKTAKIALDVQGEGLTYKWYYKNKGDSKFSYTSTFKGDTYSVEMNASRSGRQVYCRVTDKFGNVVATKVVTLSMKVRIATQPKSVTVAKGKTAKTTVKAQGEGLKYTWYYKDKGASKFVKTSSFTGSSYYVAMTKARNGRQVYCKITDKFGNTVTTNTVTLKMK